MAELYEVSTQTSEILGASPARELLQDIFADLHPALIDESRDLASIFTPQICRGVSFPAYQLRAAAG